MSDIRNLLRSGMAGGAQQALSGRQRTIDAAEEQSVGGSGSSAPADSSGQGAPGMSQSQFSGYGKKNAKKSAKLAELLRKRDAE